MVRFPLSVFGCIFYFLGSILMLKFWRTTGGPGRVALPHFHTQATRRRDPGPFLHFFSASKNINMSHDIYPCLLALLSPLLPLPQVQKWHLDIECDGTIPLYHRDYHYLSNCVVHVKVQLSTSNKLLQRILTRELNRATVKASSYLSLSHRCLHLDTSIRDNRMAATATQVEVLFDEVCSVDFLKFSFGGRGYQDQLYDAIAKTETLAGVKVECLTFPNKSPSSANNKVVWVTHNFGFLGGSLGCAEGEKITRAFEYGLEHKVHLATPITAS